MKESDLVGTWKYSSWYTRATGMFTFEASGNYTEVEDGNTFPGIITALIFGRANEGTWHLNQDGTELYLNVRHIDSMIPYLQQIIKIIPDPFGPYKITVQESSKGSNPHKRHWPWMKSPLAAIPVNKIALSSRRGGISYDLERIQ